MDIAQLRLVRDVLESSGWLERTRSFGQSLRSSTREPGGLLLVGTPDDEPWHFAAHLSDEARYSGQAQLAPTLVRWQPPPGAPLHLSIGLDRLAEARRGEALLVVAPEAAPESLLERVSDARRTGATVLALDSGDPELEGLAHDVLTVSASGLVLPVPRRQHLLAPVPLPAPVRGLALPFDLAEHLVSAAAGEQPGSGSSRLSFRDRLARALDKISGPVSEPPRRTWPAQ